MYMNESKWRMLTAGMIGMWGVGLVAYMLLCVAFPALSDSVRGPFAIVIAWIGSYVAYRVLDRDNEK